MCVCVYVCIYIHMIMYVLLFKYIDHTIDKINKLHKNSMACTYPHSKKCLVMGQITCCSGHF